MLQIPLKNIISLSAARHNFSKLIDKAIKNESFLITKGGKPAVVITGIEMIEQLYRQGIMATEATESGSKKSGTGTLKPEGEMAQAIDAMNNVLDVQGPGDIKGNQSQPQEDKGNSGIIKKPSEGHVDTNWK